MDICRPQVEKREIENMDNRFAFLAFIDSERKKIAFESNQVSEKSTPSMSQEINNCPDCRIKLIRLGNCFSCPLCGYGGCG